MPKDLTGQRRRAAVAVLSGLLDENSLLQELWIQHDTLRGETVTEIIEYVDALARRHLLDVATAKRLYGEFFRALRLPESQLPLDPWPAMQQVRAASAMASPVAVGPAWGAPVPALAPRLPEGSGLWQAPRVPSPSPVAWSGHPMTAPMPESAPDPRWAPPPAAVAAPTTAPAVAVATPAPALVPPANTAAEAAAVFAALMRNMVSEIVEHHGEALEEIGRDAQSLAVACPVTADVRVQFGKAWQRPQRSEWRVTATAAELAELTRVVHRALELSFGRTGADHILQRGTEAAQDVPEAADFSPNRLWAAL